jgi:hypothetical protein
MKLNLSILKTATILFVIGCCIYTIVNYQILAGNGGWGIVAMIGFTLFGLTMLVADGLIIYFFKNLKHRRIANIIVLLCYMVYIVFFSGFVN